MCELSPRRQAQPVTISDKTRKLLWGGSGRLCASCRRQLVVDGFMLDDDSVVGEECHIVSASKRGPRFDPAFSAAFIDDESNLILLCGVHHKMVDDQPRTWTAARLRELKAEHERWVRSRLSHDRTARVRVRGIAGKAPDHLLRLTAGRQLIGIIDGACSSDTYYDEPEDDAEVDLIASFFQLAQDYADMSGGLEAGERVRAGRELGVIIEELEHAGFWVFGVREVRRLEGGVGKPAAWPVAILYLLRSSNPEIIHVPAREQASTGASSEAPHKEGDA